jgi:hypothetical protein
VRYTPAAQIAPASSNSATGKIFFGESSSVRLRGPDDFPLMPRLPLVEELFEAASRSTKKTLRIQGDDLSKRRFATGRTRDEKIDLKQQAWREVGDVGFGYGGG